MVYNFHLNLNQRIFYHKINDRFRPLTWIAQSMNIGNVFFTHRLKASILKHHYQVMIENFPGYREKKPGGYINQLVQVVAK